MPLSRLIRSKIKQMGLIVNTYLPVLDKVACIIDLPASLTVGKSDIFCIGLEKKDNYST